MPLFSSIQLANNALRAQQIGLQVVGQNISNANTPGYIREEVIFSPAPTQKVGNLLLGLGVNVTGVVQKLDTFLEDRLRGAISDRAGSEAQENAYLELEGLIGELSDTDLSTLINEFFFAVDNINNQPESVSVRNLAVLQGQTLAGEINRLANRVDDVRTDLNERVIQAADDINGLVEEIRTLNIQITEAEGGSVSKSDAVGLRDQRLVALTNLAELIDIRVDEQPGGAVNVFVGGDYLVFGSATRQVEVAQSTDRGLTIGTIRLADTQSELTINSGEVPGLVTARDSILGGFLDKLNSLSSTLIFEFNRIFSSGQGLNGHDSLTSEFAVSDVTADLDSAGLAFTPVNGSFQIEIYNKTTQLSSSPVDVFIDLDGLDDDDTSLTDLAAAINAINGITATITPTRNLSITSDSPDQQIAFKNDTSGVLAALGLNTFFIGRDARDIGVSQTLKDDPAKFAASTSGVGPDSSNAILLAQFADQRLETQNNATLNDLYDRMIGETTQGSSVAGAVADGLRVFESTLQGQKLAVSGVSIDEEAVRLIAFQQVFQATARYIATLNDLLNILVNL